MSRIKLKQIAIEKNERIDNPSQSSYTGNDSSVWKY